MENNPQCCTGRKKPSAFRVKGVSFLKNTSSFSFSPLPYSGASDLGKIYANFSGEIVTSSSVLIHRDIITLSELIPGELLTFRREGVVEGDNVLI